MTENPSSGQGSGHGDKDLMAYELAALLYAIGYILVLLFAWITKAPVIVSSFVSRNAETNQLSCEGLSSVCALVFPMSLFGAESGKIIAILVLALLIFTNLRVIIASMLCHFDGIPLKDEIRRQRGKHVFKSLLIFYVLLKAIALASLWRAYTVGVAEPWLLPAAFMFEWLLVIGFDVYFWKELKKQQDFLAIVLVDAACLLIGAAWLLAALMNIATISDGIKTAYLFIFGGLCLPFFVMAGREIIVYGFIFMSNFQKLRLEWKSEA